MRMRQKVDRCVNGQVYELFKQSRTFDGGRAGYSFAPNEDVKYCIIVRGE